ncbi:MAG TPA: hypothetical protein VHW23_15230 [Kofleriaceae bacterium]|nr:hypothetical protein [Kofleriaceae bacterium]
MPHSDSQISEIDLGHVTGGANLDFNAIRQQAQSYCPSTAARYAHVDPASVNRPVAQKMANQCLAEMGPFTATFARGPIQSAIDRAFPR